MAAHHLSAVFALLANLCFSFSSLFFARFSVLLGATWMNTLKASVALIGFGILALFAPAWLEPSNTQLSLLFISGFIGLGIGDIFLLKAFTTLGPARTLVLFAFQPMIFIFVDSYVFDQSLKIHNFIAIAIFIICLILFTLENKNPNRKWTFTPLLIALTGIFLDGAGVFLTKKVFASEPVIDSLQANLIRTSGAVTFYILFNFIKPINLIRKFKTLDRKLKIQAISVSVLGTFLSLFFYLNALKLGALSVVTAISVTSPIFSTLWESLLENKKPTRTLYICLMLFLVAFFLNFSQLSS